MHQLVIAYQYWQIVFSKFPDPKVADDSESDSRLSLLRGESSKMDYLFTTDENLEECFKMIVDQHRNVWVHCRDFRRLIAYLKSNYKYLKAAGGIVHPAPYRHPSSEAQQPSSKLLIYRNEHWDMAKGKVEPGETLLEAAKREVEEETGLAIAMVGDLVVKTYHIYDLYGGWHLKQTSWYEMKDSASRPIKTQQEEGITRAEWTSLSEWKKRLTESYSMMALISRLYDDNPPENPSEATEEEQHNQSSKLPSTRQLWISIIILLGLLLYMCIKRGGTMH